MPEEQHPHRETSQTGGPDLQAGDEFRPESVPEAESDVEAPVEQVARRLNTFAAFAHRDYTFFWSGAFVSNIGTWMQMAVLALVVYSFRRSESDLGIVNGISTLPVLFLAIPAGLLADRVNRRRLIMWAQGALLLQAAALGALYATGNLTKARPLVSLAIVAALGLFGGLMSALTFPAWQSMVPDLVPREVLLNGIALNAAQFQGARLMGPLIAGGILLLLPGAYEVVFYINAVSFIFVIGALAVVRVHPDALQQRRLHEQTREREQVMKTLTAGLAYARQDRTVGILILSVGMMTVFGMPYMMLLPAIVDKALLPAALVGIARDHMKDAWYNYILAANGLGALVGALTVASLPKSVKREPLVRYTLMAMALLLIAFSLSRQLWLTIALSAFAGAAFLTSTSLMNTSIQASVPHHLRGRVMSLFVMAFMGLMPISSLAFGPLGQAIGPTNAVIAGAVVLALYSLFLILRPGLLDREAREADVRSAGGGAVREGSR